ncbi:MAG: flagellar hook-length control protein FliK [Pelotomaculum sp.]|uniref:Flagellar hook-length control protein-like C-terminal domain-containing protein n=1 Tax=Pelotomaculum thermopropionicum (strain DSM 13744 / JCM 10971 / SI) TaxID=370438 RepID=A5D542_PELTS|nr:flagellar hook-length control protein FliK [Pelotomaculum sp.]BAF58645.1 hypothetical protein PTH_0465 [Pelotomaculum thermopropionicum SI]
MNINALTGLLLELASQSTSKTTRIAKAEGPPRLPGEAPAAFKSALRAASGAGPAPEQPALQKAGQPADEASQLPPFIPLPLRSELFREARFFARTGGGRAGKAAARAPASDVFICLVTENLGRLWAGLSWRDELLSVRYFTENEAASRMLAENFPELKESLQEIGFAEVSLSSLVRGELKAIAEELLPKFQAHLLDRKI